MPQLPTHLLLVTAEVDDSVEAAFNLWYDTEHLPAALACPGVLRGRRYATSKPTTRIVRMNAVCCLASRYPNPPACGKWSCVTWSRPVRAFCRRRVPPSLRRKRPDGSVTFWKAP